MVEPDVTLGPVQVVPFLHGAANLLWAGSGVRVTAADPADPKPWTVTFAVPGPHQGQVPLSLDVTCDPPAALAGWVLKPRPDRLNWVVEATVNPGTRGATVCWEATLLTHSREQPAVAGPLTHVTRPAVTPDLLPWVQPSACVQSDQPGIVARAKALRAKESYLCSFASDVTKWVEQNLGTGKPLDTLDAAAALGCGGSCTSRANLCAALLRAEGVPARTVAHLPAEAGPLYVHWLTEYWHPGSGWQML